MTHVSIAGGIFVRGDRLLLAKRAPHKTAYPNCWDFIGGHVEPGESVEQTLIREAREEIGLTPLRFTPVGTILGPNPALYGDAVYHLFMVTEWSGGKPKMLGAEHTELRWFTQEEACRAEPLGNSDYRAIFKKFVWPRTH